MKQAARVFTALMATGLATVLVSSGGTAHGQVPAPGASPAVEERVADLLAQMTVEEKLDMLSGTGFDTRPLERLGIPAMKMADGPVGVRSGQATAFPAGVALAASWDPALVEEVGRALGQEARAKGKNVLLGPTVNIHRVPQGGRNFESFGEDPFLAARIAVGYIKGVQSEHVIATVKHFACNNQEYERRTIDVKVDERTLNEIYLPAFKAAVREAGVWAVMGAYNRVNGEYACANRTLLTTILKEGWGFPGLVMSDWGAVHGVVPYVNAGLDLEMPGGQFLTRANLQKALEAGEIDQTTIDDKVRRTLRAMLAMGLFDEQQDPGALDTPEHRALARRAAAEGVVLLRNAIVPDPQHPRAVLPLTAKTLRSLAVLGPNAAVARTGGGGSSQVTPPYAVSPLEGLKTRFPFTRIEYALGAVDTANIEAVPSAALAPPEGAAGTAGLLGEYFEGTDLTGEPAFKRVDAQVDFDWQDDGPGGGLAADGFSVRWTGQLRPRESGKYAIGLRSDDGSRLFLDDKLLIDNWGQHGTVTRTQVVELKTGHTHAVRIEYFEAVGAATMVFGWQKLDKDPLEVAVKTARDAQAAIVFVGLSGAQESEGSDRETLALPDGQDELIAAVAEANPNTVVVINSGAAVMMDRWIRRIPAIIQAWYLGQETGNALADVISGEVNPSGKLPTTFLASGDDSAAHGNYPGQDGVVRYAEGIFVGYRHFEKMGLGVLFPFGHGIGYSGFAYRDLRLSAPAMTKDETIDVSFSVTNTGEYDGAEVVQLYIRDLRSSLPRPSKELKGFQKLAIKKGETREARFKIDTSLLSFYDPAQHSWVAEPGDFEVLIGSSSQDIWLRRRFALQ